MQNVYEKELQTLESFFELSQPAETLDQLIEYAIEALEVELVLSGVEITN
jgi:hypothetical protein